MRNKKQHVHNILDAFSNINPEYIKEANDTYFKDNNVSYVIDGENITPRSEPTNEELKFSINKNTFSKYNNKKKLIWAAVIFITATLALIAIGQIISNKKKEHTANDNKKFDRTQNIDNNIIKNASPEDTLTDYVKNNLHNQLGEYNYYANSYKYEESMDSTGYAKYLNGILNYKINDFDNDGTAELLVLYIANQYDTRYSNYVSYMRQYETEPYSGAITNAIIARMYEYNVDNIMLYDEVCLDCIYNFQADNIDYYKGNVYLFNNSYIVQSGYRKDNYINNKQRQYLIAYEYTTNGFKLIGRNDSIETLGPSIKFLNGNYKHLEQDKLKEIGLIHSLFDISPLDKNIEALLMYDTSHEPSEYEQDNSDEPYNIELLENMNPYDLKLNNGKDYNSTFDERYLYEYINLWNTFYLEDDGVDITSDSRLMYTYSAKAINRYFNFYSNKDKLGVIDNQAEKLLKSTFNKDILLSDLVSLPDFSKEKVDNEHNYLLVTENRPYVEISSFDYDSGFDNDCINISKNNNELNITVSTSFEHGTISNSEYDALPTSIKDKITTSEYILGISSTSVRLKIDMQLECSESTEYNYIVNSLKYTLQ